MAGNLLIVHGGGPTAVINSSLYGAIRQAQESPWWTGCMRPSAAPAAC